MMRNDIVLTGLARSGTTLVVSILNRLENVVALHEPINFTRYPLTPERAVDDLQKYFRVSRDEILSAGQIDGKLVNGGGGNSFGEKLNNFGLRKSIDYYGIIEINKSLVNDFLFVVKHPMAFTALVGVLSSAFPVFALIRNPLSVLASWNSIDHSLIDGRAPQAELRDSFLKSRLDDESDFLNRQLIVLDWAFGQYGKFLSASSIIRYEQVILTEGKCLDVIVKNARALSEPISSRNANGLYNLTMLDNWFDRMLIRGGAWLDFYSERKIKEMYLEMKNVG